MDTCDNKKAVFHVLLHQYENAQKFRSKRSICFELLNIIKWHLYSKVINLNALSGSLIWNSSII